MAFAWRTADSRRFGLFQAQNSDWSEPWPPRGPQPEVKSLRAYFRSNLGGTLLGKIGPAARDAVPELARLLNDPDKGVRAAAASALGRIGPAARDAVPEL